MLSWIVSTFFSSLLATLSTTAVIVIVCGVVAWFVPPLRRYAVMAGGVALAAATIYTKGNRDAKRKWQEAIERDAARGEQARRDAERDVDSGRVHGDEWDRDKG